MAGVIGKIDALPRRGPAIHPSHGGAGQPTGTCRNDAGGKGAHLDSSSRAIRAVRRQIVTMQPRFTMTRVAQSTVPAAKILVSNIESTQAAVSVAMRCCFAIGPMKLCFSPEAPPSILT